MPATTDATFPLDYLQSGIRIARKPFAPSARAVGIVVMTLLTLCYALLQNPYWVRHGDSEVYLSLARNLVTGKGYTFGGQPIGIVTPAWPLVLAGALKITTRLAILKLLPMLSFLGFAVMSYVVLLRFTTPMIAGFCVMTAALLEPVFSLTNMFFSDGPFALLAITAVWWALRINDGADSWWRIAVLAGLCVLHQCIHMRGLIWFAVIAAALLHGELWPRFNRRWLALGLCMIVALATYFVLTWKLSVDPSQLDPRYDSSVSRVYGVANIKASPAELYQRFLDFGRWIGGLIWKPSQMAQSTRLLGNICGWIASLLTLIVIIPAALRREWLLLGAAVFAVVLAAIWNDPLSRYLIPAAPLILLAIYQSLSRLAGWFGSASNWLRPLLLNVFFASVLLANGLLYAENVIIMRAHDFYGRFHAGVHRQMIDAAWYLNHQQPGNYEIAVSPRFVNFDREYNTDGFRRAMVFLTDRSIMTVPMELCREPDADVIDWCVKNHVRFYMFQPPLWLIEHFHLKSRNGISLTTEDTAWRLYEIKDGQANRIDLKPANDWPRNVPGI